MVPWGIFCFLTAWNYQSYLDSFPEPWSTILLWGAMALPAPIAFVFGCYSIKVAGTGWRNILGVIATAVSIVLGIAWLIFIGICLKNPRIGG